MFLFFRHLFRFRSFSRYFVYSCVLSVIVLVYFLVQSKILCFNVEARNKANQICQSLQTNVPVGNLCFPLCIKEDITSISCYSFRSTKRVRFKAEWRSSHIVFKSPIQTTPFHWFENGKKVYPSEKQFLTALRAVVRNKLNLNLPVNTLMRILKKNIHSRNSEALEPEEIDVISTLVQDNEFLILTFFPRNDIFPRLIGTCGSHYATEYVEPLQVKSSLFALTDSAEDWIGRLQLAAQILELLKKLDSDFQEPIHLCDVQLQHFGIYRDDESLRYLDLNHLYPRSVISKFFRNLTCQSDDDCDFMDCRSKCSPLTKKCAVGVTNNNFQVVCEKLFLGWRRSNTVIVPGLLLSQHTPSDLAAVVRQCGNPEQEVGKARRGPDENVIKRMHELIVEIEQTFINRLSP